MPEVFVVAVSAQFGEVLICVLGVAMAVLVVVVHSVLHKWEWRGSGAYSHPYSLKHVDSC